MGQSVGGYDFQTSADQYNRVIGADYNLSSKDNVWNGKALVHKSFNPDDKKGNLMTQGAVMYNTRKYNFAADLFFVDDGFKSDLGFVPRVDILRWGLFGARNFYPKSEVFNTFRIEYLHLYHFRPSLNYRMSDQLSQAAFSGSFKNQSTFSTTYYYNFTYLTDGFDPTGTDGGEPIPGDADYRYSQLELKYASNQANVFLYSFGANLGEFFNGHAYSYNAAVNVRIQPWANIGAIVRYDQIRLPDPHPSADLWLVTPKFDVTFSKKLFWSTLIQYSNQRNNLGINSRLQWRYAPLSDLYLVYNDNYIPESLQPQFRSINLKLSYWFNPSFK